MNSRPSPSESATLFKVGTIKTGNDKKKWIVYRTQNNQQRWKRLKSPDQNIKVLNDTIIEFRLDGYKSIKKLGKINIKSKVVVGEYEYNPKGFNFGKNTHIYKVDDCLILSKSILTKSQIKKMVWKNTLITVSVDGGMFGFWDLNILQKLNPHIIKIEQAKLRNRKLRPGMVRKLKTHTPKYDDMKTAILKIKDLTDSEYYINEGFDANTFVGVISPTGTGDGRFYCFKSSIGSSLMLLGGNTEMKLWDKIDSAKMPLHLKVVDRYRKRKK